jgi:hypothetical protein
MTSVCFFVTAVDFDANATTVRQHYLCLMSAVFNFMFCGKVSARKRIFSFLIHKTHCINESANRLPIVMCLYTLLDGSQSRISNYNYSHPYTTRAKILTTSIFSS